MINSLTVILAYARIQENQRIGFRHTPERRINQSFLRCLSKPVTQCLREGTIVIVYGFHLSGDAGIFPRATDNTDI